MLRTVEAVCGLLRVVGVTLVASVVADDVVVALSAALGTVESVEARHCGGRLCLEGGKREELWCEFVLWNESVGVGLFYRLRLKEGLQLVSILDSCLFARESRLKSRGGRSQRWVPRKDTREQCAERIIGI